MFSRRYVYSSVTWFSELGYSYICGEYRRTLNQKQTAAASRGFLAMASFLFVLNFT